MSISVPDYISSGATPHTDGRAHCMSCRSERDVLEVGPRSLCAFEVDEHLLLTRSLVREKKTVTSLPY
jgi:hypothetical protein